MKKLTTKSVIANYEKACNDVATLFAKTYFGDPFLYWIGGEIGGVMGINDYFFNVDDIVVYLKEKATQEELLAYYDFIMEAHVKGSYKPTFKYWRVHRTNL